MHQAGLLSNRDDVADGRRVCRYTITSHGKEALEQCRQALRDLVAEFLPEHRHGSRRHGKHPTGDVPLTERWSPDRLRRIAILDLRLARTVAEVLFIDRHDTAAASKAAALLASYARGRFNISSAGENPGPSVDATVTEVTHDVSIDISDAFPKPLTDDAVRRRRWDIEELDGETHETVQAACDELDRRVLRLLADLLAPTTS
jgi:protein-tyrosine-phosphatase